jgi:tetratricopeptide (TPR) repeat protein
VQARPPPQDLFARAQLCLQAGQLVQALQVLRHAEGLCTTSPLQAALGAHLAACGAYKEACAWLDRAIATAPAPGALYNRATALRALGRLEAAETDLDLALKLSPNDWEAIGLRSQLRRQTKDRNHVAELRAGLGNPALPISARVQLGYALGKELEDLCDEPGAFLNIGEAAALHRRHLRYDVGNDVETMARIAATHEQSWFARCAGGASSTAPIFVVGLPRSGTTLVERILSSHPDVKSAGEANAFPAALLALGKEMGGWHDKAGLVALSARMAPARLAAGYQERMAALGVEGGRSLDKLPLNTLYLGLIAASFPNASLVYVTRHPVGNCYAAWKTLFQQGYPWSYDFYDLAQYWAAHDRLTAHWRHLLGDRLITVTYETLVANPGAEIRRLVAACKLGWHDRCLLPHQNPAASATQSASQVRRPIYTESAQAWRAIPGLAPLKAALVRAGVAEARLA